MPCPSCQSEVSKKHGHTSDGRPRFRCRDCRRVWVDTKLPKPARRPRRIPEDRAVMILGMLCEGSSIRAIQRLVGVEQRTILRLLVDFGTGCERLLEEMIQGVPVKDVEADELWTYIRAKAATVARKKLSDPDAGDAYCYIGMETNSKLVLAWHLGRRNKWDAHDFIEKLSRATTGHFQFTTDGFSGYEGATDYHLGARVDYAQVVKQFGSVGGEEARRYAPPRLIGQEKTVIYGEPDEDRISTSRVERMNWTIRTGLRRFVRLSNGFSRKKENLRAAIALFIAYYNFVKFHKSVRMPPAMAAGIIGKPWTLADLLREANRRIDRGEREALAAA
jgi:transposase-like protein/IS1 family transposase